MFCSKQWFHRICKNYGLQISALKAKMMASHGTDAVDGTGSQQFWISLLKCVSITNNSAIGVKPTGELYNQRVKKDSTRWRSPSHTCLWVWKLDFTEIPGQSCSWGRNEIFQPSGRMYFLKSKKKCWYTAEDEYYNHTRQNCPVSAKIVETS